MKMFLVWVTILTSCNVFAQLSPQEFEKAFNEIKEKYVSKINECSEQGEEIVSMAVTDIDEKDVKSDLRHAFVKDEKEALLYIDKFDSNKLHFFEDENAQWDLILKNCTKENLKIYTDFRKKHAVCNSTFSSYNYMQGLIFAILNYKWSDAANENAKQKILDYLQFIANNKNTLLDKLIALDLTEKFVSLVLKDKKLIKEIQKLKKESEKLGKSLSMGNGKKTEKESDYTCNDLPKFNNDREKEQKASQVVGQKLGAFLKSIKFKN